MKKCLAVLAITLLNGAAQAERYRCTFQSGEVVDVQLPCDTPRVARFEKRLIALYPEVLEINSSHDYLMGLYIFAMSSCTGHFADMSPEAIGEGGEPFFARNMLAAMVRAGREVMCPQLGQSGGLLSK